MRELIKKIETLVTELKITANFKGVNSTFPHYFNSHSQRMNNRAENTCDNYEINKIYKN
jgi:hypothetical protein